MKRIRYNKDGDLLVASLENLVGTINTKTNEFSVVLTRAESTVTVGTGTANSLANAKQSVRVLMLTSGLKVEVETRNRGTGETKSVTPSVVETVTNKPVGLNLN